ncbi:MAG: DUF4357 domain-containing protein [Xanthomonadaceae bacterium]|nr:DUF4357 domain-containing protein [Xanthomonadaceae bacterium]
MSRTLIANEQPLSRIFSDEYVFSIPGYQRPYAWTTEQAGELFEDLRDFMKGDERPLPHVPPYFLGSIVLIKEEESPPAIVVDGQQRLTTLTLLLSAIRASATDTQVRKGLSRLIYEQGDVIVNTANHYRLTLRERDREFFREFVQHENGITRLVQLDRKLSDSQSKLRENAKLFQSRLADISEAERVKLAQFMATRCYMVVVCTPDLDSAYRIFDVLNSRGLDLSATDILKAEIIGKIPADKRSHYTKTWEDIEQDLGRDDFGNLFSHIRMIYRKAKPKGTLLKEFRDHVPIVEPMGFVDAVLVPLAEAYREIAGADYSSQSGAEVVNANFAWLNRIEFKDWMPPALAFLSAHRNEPQEVSRFFVALERLVYSMMIAKWGVNNRIERCSALTASIYSNHDLWALDSPLLMTPREKRDVYDALSGSLYETHSARALATILLRLDGLLSGGGASYEYGTITVEHVLPQSPKPGSHWLIWFPDEQGREYWVDRLGNLALLTRKKNSSANNRDFEWKKQAYFAKSGISPFVLTTQVIRVDEWTPEVVSRLQNERLATFERHLDLFDRADPIPRSVVDHDTAELADLDRLFYCKASEADAQARCTRGGVCVLKGSTGRAEVVDSLKARHGYSQLREQLLDQGIIVRTDDGRIRFVTDHIFSSPSAAAVAVTGRPANGWVEWQDGNGVSLREACRAAKADSV